MSADNREMAERHMFKYTECGANIHFDDDGVTIGSIVEGSDADIEAEGLADTLPTVIGTNNTRLASVNMLMPFVSLDGRVESFQKSSAFCCRLRKNYTYHQSLY